MDADADAPLPLLDAGLPCLWPEHVGCRCSQPAKQFATPLFCYPTCPTAPRSVPHILSDESSAYYHGYVLAEMAVHQTRAHFLSTYGRIVDEPRVGADLANVYWAPGSGEAFLDLVARLTGAPLTSAAWVKELQVGRGWAGGGRGCWWQGWLGTLLCCAVVH
jgi:hypothetical protein